MKKILLIIVISLFTGYSQSISDSTQIKRNPETDRLKNQNVELKQVQDKTGPKQNTVIEIKKSGKKKDVFIDKDGDGICDTRQSGMSFNKMRKRFGAGKNGPGGQGGNGNNGNGYGGGR